MTSTSTIKLYASDVNGGVAVILNGATFSYGVRSLSSVDSVPSKWDTVPVNKLGFENPRFGVSGVIDSDMSTANYVTINLLKDFIRTQNEVYLIIRYGNEGLEKAFSDINKTSTVIGSDVGVRVVLSNTQINGASDSRNGHFFRYTLDLYEDSI